MLPLKSLIKDVWAGKSIARATINDRFSKVQMFGLVVDVGGAKHADYIKLIKWSDNFQIEVVDGSLTKVDFEVDPLPYQSSSVDGVLCLNVLEHIFNHDFLVVEMARILKVDGRLVGFVPFLVNVHKDPHDYFRYTDEALEKIFKAANFSKVSIEPIGAGPGFVGLNCFVLSLPRWLRPGVVFLAYIFDKIWLYFKPKTTSRLPLGYFFECVK